MFPFRYPLLAMLIGLFNAVSVGSEPPTSRPATRVAPKLSPVAETKLLMEGLAQPNFQGIEKILGRERIDVDSWGFARGQALIIAETGNLLMLRPPRNTGQDVWMQSAMELRESATRLAKAAASRDVEASRLGVRRLAQVCNSCHQTFKVPTKITAFEDSKP